MTFEVGAASLGISEQEWLPTLARRRAPGDEMAWGDGNGELVVVVAPHPDDEVLGAGGTMLRLAHAGFKLRVVAVTDGEASHPRSVIPPGLLAERRTAERADALNRLGVGEVDVVRLRIPDGGVGSAEGLARELVTRLRGAAWCLAPWERDGHPDHDAVGAATQRAASLVGVRVARYPVWAWHWCKPDDPRWPWCALRRSTLDDAALSAKRHAIDAFASQVRPFGAPVAHPPILPPAVVARFERAFETFFV